MRQYFAFLAGLVFAVLFYVHPAFAALPVGDAAVAADPAVASVPGAVDIGPLLKDLLGLVLASITGALLVGVHWIFKKVGLDNAKAEQVIHDKLEALMDTALQFAIGKLEKAEWTQIQTKNEIVSAAMKFVVEHGAGWIDKLGWTDDKVQAYIEAKLLKYDQAPGVWNK